MVIACANKHALQQVFHTFHSLGLPPSPLPPFSTRSDMSQGSQIPQQFKLEETRTISPQRPGPATFSSCQSQPSKILDPQPTRARSFQDVCDENLFAKGCDRYRKKRRQDDDYCVPTDHTAKRGRPPKVNAMDRVRQFQRERAVVVPNKLSIDDRKWVMVGGVGTKKWRRRL